MTAAHLSSFQKPNDRYELYQSEPSPLQDCGEPEHPFRHRNVMPQHAYRLP